jgi:hypothetical protein
VKGAQSFTGIGISGVDASFKGETSPPPLSATPSGPFWGSVVMDTLRGAPFFEPNVSAPEQIVILQICNFTNFQNFLTFVTLLFGYKFH